MKLEINEPFMSILLYFVLYYIGKKKIYELNLGPLHYQSGVLTTWLSRLIFKVHVAQTTTFLPP